MMLDTLDDIWMHFLKVSLKNAFSSQLNDALWTPSISSGLCCAQLG